MNVLVFGASGATGLELLRQGPDHGHAITAFVRNPAAIDASYRNVQLVQGNVEVRASVENAMAGQQAVICVLGSRTLLRRDLAIVVGVHNIITVMELSGIRRLVYLSADSVRASLERSNPVRRLILSVVLRNPTADHELNERMIRESHLEWTVVRPPKLTNGRRTGKYQSGEHVQSSHLIPQISRADLAEFMLKHLADQSFVHKAVELMY
jgi:putative NADH-flavin reductase